MKILIENSSNEGDVVCDMFMGSGSTGVACIESNRKFIGCEVDLDFYTIAEDRVRCEVGHINRLDLDAGHLWVEGTVGGLEYHEQSAKKGLFSSLFR